MKKKEFKQAAAKNYKEEEYEIELKLKIKGHGIQGVHTDSTIASVCKLLNRGFPPDNWEIEYGNYRVKYDPFAHDGEHATNKIVTYERIN